jgi:hypothetical protein
VKRKAAIALLCAGCATTPSREGSVHAFVAGGKRSVRPAEYRGRISVFAPDSDPCPETTRSFQQPIAVVEDQRIARHPSVIGFPIAFAKDVDIRSLAGFRAVTLDGVALPTQMEILSRWGTADVSRCDAPIRWAYAFVRAEAPPGERSYLVLQHGPRSATTASVAVSIVRDKDRLLIDTGPARFALRQDGFDGLDSVELLDGDRARTIATGGAMIAERGADRYTPKDGRLISFEVERRGPVVATVRATGTYGKKGGDRLYRYTVRFHFYAGSAAVQIDHTYYNGDLTDITAHGGKNRVESDRVLMRFPLRLGSAPKLVARALERVHPLAGDQTVELMQRKRTPDEPRVRFTLGRGTRALEVGAYADHPMLAAGGESAYAIATVSDLGPRDPQGLRFDPRDSALEIEWQSEPMAIGGGRGIWSKAVVDFGEGPDREDLALRGTQLYAHASRPLIGVPSASYLNTTRARPSLPAGELDSAYARFDDDVDVIHENTARYLRNYHITGTQIWPDMPRTTCSGRSCVELEQGYFEGGDCNYWDWSLVELEAFLRSADPAFIHDFALPEAITMAETISFRPDPGSRSDESSFAGFSPCYGGARGYDDNVWVEGLNHRRGACPGDYSYNKVHKLAYLLTADRRFLDFFAQGADTAIRMYKTPWSRPPDKWLELSASRTVYQYLELLLDAAEFARTPAADKRYRDVALAYFDHMKEHALERGHTCNTLGTGQDDPKKLAQCSSDQAWMLPVWIEWVERIAVMYAHRPARDWLLDFVKMSARRHTVVDDSGRPDISRAQTSSGDDGENGWRTVYQCRADAHGIQDATCRKLTSIENQAYFYPNGLIAYLNAFALVLDAIPEDPSAICRWLPDAYASALRSMEREMGANVWGKELGQAYAMTQSALGALERCKARSGL